MQTKNFNSLAKQQPFLDFAKKFITICNRENIWYSLDKQTLRSSQTQGKFVLGAQAFEVMVTIRSYRKLKRICPKHIVDSFSDPTYTQLAPLFVANNRDWQSPQPVIRIRILVPTTTLKLQHFFSLCTFLKNKIRSRPCNIKNAINDLVDWRRFEGYYLLESRKHFVRQNWIQTLSFETKKITFFGLPTAIIKEYDRILKYWYGAKYLEKTTITQMLYNYNNPFYGKSE